MNDARKVEALERRRDYLAAKLAEGGYSDSAASWAGAEVAALEWAIPLLTGEQPRGLRERHNRDLHAAARTAARLAREHPDMPVGEVAMAALPDDARLPIRVPS